MYKEASDYPKIHPSGMWLDKREHPHHPKDMKVTLTSKKGKNMNLCTHVTNFESERFCTRVNS